MAYERLFRRNIDPPVLPVLLSLLIVAVSPGRMYELVTRQQCRTSAAAVIDFRKVYLLFTVSIQKDIRPAQQSDF